MKLICACGKPATWYLVYGCSENQHIWETHICRHCLYLTIRFDKTWPIRNHVYQVGFPWTCMNIRVAEDMQLQIPEPNWELNCQVTSWYAREITPDMHNRIVQKKLKEFKERFPPNVYH